MGHTLTSRQSKEVITIKIQLRHAAPPITIDLHGLKLTFQAPDSPLRERFETVYGHLPRLNRSTDEILIEWRLHKSSMAPKPPPGTPVILEGDLVSYYGNAALVTIRMPKYGLITVDLSANHLIGTVTRNCLEVYGAFEDVMMISLAPLYRRRGWYPLHAFAAQAPNGKATLITGEMGSGKTTTGLALLSAGWKLLSNDTPLLTVQDGIVQVLAYPGQLSAFDDSLARFEQLKKFIPVDPVPTPEVSDPPISSGPQKHVFRAEEAFIDPWVVSGMAGGVFFPQVISGLTRSQLVEVAPTDAVLQLMPLAIEGWDKATIGQNLQLLSKLAEQVPCYALRLSPHVEQLPELIAEGMGLRSGANLSKNCNEES